MSCQHSGLAPCPTVKALEAKVAQLEEDLAMANFFIDERHRQRNEANAKVEELEDELITLLWKLGEGTLHAGYCNSDHSKRVGAIGTSCSCTLGQEIKALRAELPALKFSSLGQFNIPGKGLIIAVDLGPGPRPQLVGRAIEIDGKRYLCQGAEVAGSSPTVGLLVKPL